MNGFQALPESSVATERVGNSILTTGSSKRNLILKCYVLLLFALCHDKIPSVRKVTLILNHWKIRGEISADSTETYCWCC
jgi:hypothetical protein